MKLTQTKQSSLDFAFLEKNNPKTLEKAKKIVAELENTPRAGTGRPERLKRHKEEVWSRRLDQKNRIVYQINNDEIILLGLIGLYTDK